MWQGHDQSKFTNKKSMIAATESDVNIKTCITIYGMVRSTTDHPALSWSESNAGHIERFDIGTG